MSLKIDNVGKQYKVRASKASINALNGVSVELQVGQTLGIVGESGCGKSTLARLIVGLEKPTNGQITWCEKPIGNKDSTTLKSHHSNIQLVFQDPYSSLNPRQKIGQCISEVIKTHKLRAGSEIQKRVEQLLLEVGISPDLQHRYPHQLSGGQRQRVSIARALASEPDLLILDEPVSALDVSVRADVMNLLFDLREKFGLTYIFISHDLSMVRHISDVIAVMYLGKVVEYGLWSDVLDNPKHPYTKALIDAMPDHENVGETKYEKALMGEVPDPANMPSGCAFHLRCPIATPNCKVQTPELLKVNEVHTVACTEVEL
jgi:oligopeptide/dipeptide ABC transporter ATP-binding protein